MNRYSRLLSLSNFSNEDLKVLQSKNVLIIGVGGVGQHVSTYLITNGIEKMTIVDFDKVEISNLNRQILLEEKDINGLKVDVVKKALLNKNSEASVKTINIKINEDNIKDIITKEYDVVIDAVDNWKTKLIISDECNKKRIPFLHVGVDGMRGQYCLFKNKSLKDIVNEDVLTAPKDGVMGPMVGTISSMATVHLIEYLIGKKGADELYFYDHQNHHFGMMKI